MESFPRWHVSTTQRNHLKTNKIRKKMNAGEMAYGCGIQYSSPTHVEWVGMAGFDFVEFSCCHVAVNPETLLDCLRAAEFYGVTSVARVGSVEPYEILNLLDIGVMGIHASDVRTAKEARTLAQICKFYPEGGRGLAGSRSMWTWGTSSTREYMEEANSQITAGFQLEHVDMLKELEAILDVDGIDYYLSGRRDISQCLGLYGDTDHPEVKAFEDKVADAVHARGKKMFTECATTTVCVDLFLNSARDWLEEQRSVDRESCRDAQMGVSLVTAGKEKP